MKLGVTRVEKKYQNYKFFIEIVSNMREDAFSYVYRIDTRIRRMRYIFFGILAKGVFLFNLAEWRMLKRFAGLTMFTC